MDIETKTTDFTWHPLRFGIYWDDEDWSLLLPFITLTLHRKTNAISRSWSIARVTVWKTEFRLDVDLNFWMIGIQGALDDFGLYLGPFNIQVETGKGWNWDDELPIYRFFKPQGYAIHAYPYQCRCCPPVNRRRCDDVTDWAEARNVSNGQ